jgi:hypothetical protein
VKNRALGKQKVRIGAYFELLDQKVRSKIIGEIC